MITTDNPPCLTCGSITLPNGCPNCHPELIDWYTCLCGCAACPGCVEGEIGARLPIRETANTLPMAYPDRWADAPRSLVFRYNDAVGWAGGLVCT